MVDAHFHSEKKKKNHHNRVDSKNERHYKQLIFILKFRKKCTKQPLVESYKKNELTFTFLC